MPTICNFTKNKIFQQVFFKSFLYGYQNYFLTATLSNYLPTYLPISSWSVDRPTDWPTDRPVDRPVNQYTFTYIYTLLLSQLVLLLTKTWKRKHVVTWKTCFHAFKRQNTEQKMILVIEKLHITLYGLLESLVPFSKMMVRQRIRTNYCLKDFVTFWMTKTQKTWICCLKQLGCILLNNKKTSMKKYY